MPNLNITFLMGNVTRDPEVKYSAKGTAICQIGLAINRVWTDGNGEKQEDTLFTDVEFYGKSAETIGEYVKKGHPLFVQGRLRLDQWEDKQTGDKRSKMKVIGESFQFLKGRDGGSKGADQYDQEQEGRGRSAGAPPERRSAGQGSRLPTRPVSPPPRPPVDPDLDSAEDDIPFRVADGGMFDRPVLAITNGLKRFFAWLQGSPVLAR